MIRFLQNKDINRTRWDECVMMSSNSRIYCLSWFLDIVCPTWDGLVEDDYVSVFPLTRNRKFFISYLYQPFFTQQLGLFTIRPAGDYQVRKFLEAIHGHFRFAEIHLNSDNPVPAGPWEIISRKNHELKLLPDMEILKQNYNQNTRRNIRKAEGFSLIPVQDINPPELIRLFRENFGDAEGKLQEKDYQVLLTLMNEALQRNAGKMAGIRSGDSLIAGVFLLEDPHRIIYHFAASSPEGKEKGAMFLLVDSILSGYQGQAGVLDFEGSEDENVSRFYTGFGAQTVLYPQVRIDRLPGLAKSVLGIIRKLRRH